LRFSSLILPAQLSIWTPAIHSSSWGRNYVSPWYRCWGIQ
jgi:hypothetical protein